MKLSWLKSLDSHEWRRDLGIFAALMAVTLFVRFPFFFQSVMDWDESSYILMGQSILDGNLPYIELWDNKPPLAFVPFAFFIWLFGETIIGIRLGGAICVAISGYIIFKIGQHFWGRRAGFLAAIIFIVHASFTRSGQSTMTEIIVSVPLTGALAMGMLGKENPQKFFFLGLLISLAVLTRSNLAYIALLLGGFFFIKSLIRKDFDARLVWMYVLGGLVPIGLVILPYAISGHLGLLLDSAVIIPLKYASAEGSMIKSLASLIEIIFGKFNLLLGSGALGGGYIALKNWRAYPEEQKNSLLILAIFLTGAAISIVRGGFFSHHHVIQMMPFMALLSGQFFASLFVRFGKILMGLLVLAGLMIPAWFLPLTYVYYGKKLLNHQPLRSDVGYQLVEYLKEENPTRESMYLMKYHIVHWLTQTKPLDKIVTHPSHIEFDWAVKELYGPRATTESVMTKLLGKKPLFILKPGTGRFLKKNELEVKKVLEKSLEADYILINKIQHFYIYKRKKNED